MCLAGSLKCRVLVPLRLRQPAVICPPPGYVNRTADVNLGSHRVGSDVDALCPWHGASSLLLVLRAPCDMYRRDCLATKPNNHRLSSSRDPRRSSSWRQAPTHIADMCRAPTRGGGGRICRHTPGGRSRRQRWSQVSCPSFVFLSLNQISLCVTDILYLKWQ